MKFIGTELDMQTLFYNAFYDENNEISRLSYDQILKYRMLISEEIKKKVKENIKYKKKFEYFRADDDYSNYQDFMENNKKRFIFDDEYVTCLIPITMSDLEETNRMFDMAYNEIFASARKVFKDYLKENQLEETTIIKRR